MHEREFPVWFESPDAELADSAAPFLPLVLTVAMRLGVPLRTSAPIPSSLLASADRWQQAMCRRQPFLRSVDLSLPSMPDPAPGAARGLFFSGGVDSFYALHERAAEVDWMIFVHGMDIRIGQSEAARLAGDAAAEVAAGFGKRLVRVRTNLRSLTDAYLGWAEQAFLPSLVSVALVLSPHLRHIILGGEYVAGCLEHAAAPEADPLWTTPSLSVESFGDDLQRLDKLACIGHHPLAQRCLRVCWEQPDAFNCCRCSKCLRNMSYLRALGLLPRFTCFPQPLDLDRLARLDLKDPWPHFFEGVQQALQLARRRGGDVALERALSRLYRRFRLQYALMTRLHPLAYHFLAKAVFR